VRAIVIVVTVDPPAATDTVAGAIVSVAPDVDDDGVTLSVIVLA
jgi:hypothetical protein